MIKKFTAGRVFAVATLVGLGMAFGAMQAAATTLTFDLDTEFSGATPPAGPTPWVEATFDDGGGTGTVTLTLETTNLVGSEFLSAFYFNINPALDPLSVGISNQDGTDATWDTFGFGTDAWKADGDGWFDFFVTFGNGEFTGGETWSIDLTLAGLTASDFEYLSTGGGNSPSGLFVAAHIQGIGPFGNDSGWTTGDGDDDDDDVPEPAALGLLGLGLIGLAVMRRRRKIA